MADVQSGTSVADKAFATVRREIARARLRATNGVRQMNGDTFTPVAATPHSVIWTHDIVRLRKYDAVGSVRRGPLLIVHSLVTRAHVFDLQPGSSLVEDLVTAGHDVYLLDWGVPGAVQSSNSLETYCDRLIPAALERVMADSGRDDVDILGYCLGAVMAALAVAGNTDVRAGRMVMLAPPVDFSHLGVVGNLLCDGRVEPEELIDETGNVPASLLMTSFRMAQPTLDLTTAANYWQALPDKKALGSHMAILGWSANHIPFPGAAFRQVVQWFVRERRLETGIVPFVGGDVHLEDLGTPVLCVTGQRDTLVPQESSAGLEKAMPGVPVDRISVNAGHAGLFVGRTARTGAVPQIINWLKER